MLRYLVHIAADGYQSYLVRDWLVRHAFNNGGHTWPNVGAMVREPAYRRNMPSMADVPDPMSVPSSENQPTGEICLQWRPYLTQCRWHCQEQYRPPTAEISIQIPWWWNLESTLYNSIHFRFHPCPKSTQNTIKNCMLQLCIRHIT
jgi:hypothetical protein